MTITNVSKLILCLICVVLPSAVFGVSSGSGQMDMKASAKKILDIQINDNQADGFTNELGETTLDEQDIAVISIRSNTRAGFNLTFSSQFNGNLVKFDSLTGEYITSPTDEQYLPYLVDVLLTGGSLPPGLTDDQIVQKKLTLPRFFLIVLPDTSLNTSSTSYRKTWENISIMQANIEGKAGNCALL